MDFVSLSLGVQLILEDLDALNSGIKGKGRENDRLSNITITTELFKKEFTTQIIFTSDRTIYEGIVKAVTKNINIIRYSGIFNSTTNSSIN
ncbi:uncharacterized protein PgNI_12173 [Pyricularia grisea]|uniref:Uncharacterized protein n=1 Tax=Pyricularia grisea TaxID=148305 RepID=A0A6P8AQB5_PYRGI|nr:uncharacterized protein PgNI_12173 [Pyricularia grisea]TLD04243.1 hypothetical protein PgNI_12173 [Pyricularia grisea]